MKSEVKSLDLGKLQSACEVAARTLKAANTTYNRALDARNKAEHDYSVAQKALTAGVEQLRQLTKV